MCKNKVENYILCWIGATNAGEMEVGIKFGVGCAAPRAVYRLRQVSGKTTTPRAFSFLTNLIQSNAFPQAMHQLCHK